MIQIDILIISRRLKIIRMIILINKIQWNINFCAFCCGFSIIMKISIISGRIIGASVIPMNRHKQNLAIILHDMLSAISMVNIPINNGDPLFFPLINQIVGSNRNVVVNTKAIDGVFGTRMMPRRSDYSKSVLPLAFHQFVNPFQQTSCGDFCDFF